MKYILYIFYIKYIFYLKLLLILKKTIIHRILTCNVRTFSHVPRFKHNLYLTLK